MFEKPLKRLAVFLLALLLMAACAVHKPQKRHQPKHGPIPCPVKDC